MPSSMEGAQQIERSAQRLIEKDMGVSQPRSMALSIYPLLLLVKCICYYDTVLDYPLLLLIGIWIRALLACQNQDRTDQWVEIPIQIIYLLN